MGSFAFPYSPACAWAQRCGPNGLDRRVIDGGMALSVKADHRAGWSVSALCVGLELGSIP
jgi:hypothetical protein